MLSELVARAEAGEEIDIARDGKPIVALAPVQAIASATRRLGLWDAVGAGMVEDLVLGPDDQIQEARALREAAAIDPAAL